MTREHGMFNEALQMPLSPLRWVEVASVSSTGIKKILRLSDGRRIPVHRFACVGVGDSVMDYGQNKLRAWTRDGPVCVSPSFVLESQFEVVPGHVSMLSVRELADNEDFEAYHALAQFHYRSDTSFGRRAILLMTCRDHRLPRYLGFVEITTPFLHLRNRNRLFDAPFSEPGRRVCWEKWDMGTRTRLVNAVARVSRIVVHPELRGLGFTRPLLQGASNYCVDRWQVRGLRPLFLEITADMLRFMPFVESSGLRFIGYSEGNLRRLTKDLNYLTRAVETRDLTGVTATGLGSHSVLSGKAKGILGRQRRDLRIAGDLRRKLAADLDMESFLDSLISNGSPEAHAWEDLLPLLRFPKATFMKGLSNHAEAFVHERANALGLPRGSTVPIVDSSPCSSALRLQELTLRYEVDTGTLGRTDGGEIRRAFGMDRRFRLRTGIENLNLTVQPGEVCYVYGASGAGKTSLLQLIAGVRPTAAGVCVTGSVSLPSDARIGRLRAAFLRGPLIRTIGAPSVEHAILALNAAGLAEPRIYLSDYDDLSAGQQYRAILARLLCSDSNLWLLDEFASGLDDGTAMAVGRGFARMARRRDVICIIAGVRRNPLVNAISPDCVVHLSQVGKPVVVRDWRTWSDAG